MIALASTPHGVYRIDVESEEVVGLDAGSQVEAPPPLALALPRLVTAAAEGATVIAVLDRRPPLAVSHDAGRTWREAGGGLPAGRAVAIAPGNPDLVLYAAPHRLYLSSDGGRFWRALTPELPEIDAVAWA